MESLSISEFVTLAAVSTLKKHRFCEYRKRSASVPKSTRFKQRYDGSRDKEH